MVELSVFMTADEIRSSYIEFFITQGHKEIPPAPIVPPDDPTTLFTSSGMQQLVPFLKGQEHPMGIRLVNSQPCFRAEDIEEIGDNRHTTFFEMLGNWSLGDYFKNEQLPWFFEFLTDKINLDPSRLYVSVFDGDANVPKDEESINIWQEIFKTNVPVRQGSDGFDPKVKIYSYSAEKNWWSRAGMPQNMPPGEIGGPDSEVFFDFGAECKMHENSSYKDESCHLNCECGRFLEIGNSVFMQYEKQKDGSFKPLPNKNVDFGGGLERITAASQNTPDVFQTDLFLPIFEKIIQATNKEFKGEFKQPMRVIADHIRGATIMISQGTVPSNKMQGYFVRRLLRRTVVKMRTIKAQNAEETLVKSAEAVLEMFDGLYFKKAEVAKSVKNSISEETKKFSTSLNKGLLEIEKKNPSEINAKFVFDLYQTHGFPLELTQELLAEKGIKIEKKQFEKEFNRHKEKSRTGAAGMFKGGLADKSEETIRLHTATHLLQKALRVVLGNHIRQEGSHITAERLRFDFSHQKALSAEEVKKVEHLINQKIKENLPVHKTFEEKEKALKSGAMAFFKETYPDKVSVFTIGKDPEKDWFSKELCGGPHVKSTGEIGRVRIVKQQSVGSGIRRVYASLQ